jgi:chorismate-pyruvate lyase
LEVPEKTYKKYQAELDALGNKPIGPTLLFNNLEVTRSAFTYNKTPCPFLGKGLYWARQSTFYWKSLPLTLTEIFMSDLPEIK